MTVPMLSPVLFFNLVLETIQSFQVFTPAYVISAARAAQRTPPTSTRSTSMNEVSPTPTWATPPPWHGCCWLAIGAVTVVLFKTRVLGLLCSEGA